MATLEVVEKLLTLAQVYPNQSQDAEVRKVVAGEWLRILADVPDELALVAYDEWSKSKERFAPSPGWIYTRARELTDGDANARALAAWEAVLNSDFGRDLDGVDKTARTAMQMAGGFEAFANSKVEDAHFIRDRFMKCYAELAERQDGRALIGSGAATLRLVGKR